MSRGAYLTKRVRAYFFRPGTFVPGANPSPPAFGFGGVGAPAPLASSEFSLPVASDTAGAASGASAGAASTGADVSAGFPGALAPGFLKPDLTARPLGFTVGFVSVAAVGASAAGAADAVVSAAGASEAGVCVAGADGLPGAFAPGFLKPDLTARPLGYIFPYLAISY